MYKLLSSFALAACLLSPALAFAQDVPADPICTDRPTKSNATCTVPQGSWQLESDVSSVTRNQTGGTATTTSYVMNPYLKYGVGEHEDIEINWAPNVRVRNTGDGASHTLSGAGDVYLRFKARLVNDGIFSLALIPYIKAPTAAHGIGNDRWEGGLIAPIGVALPNSFSLLLGPEVDALADSRGTGRHAAYTNLINLSHPLSSRISIAVEYWMQDNHDPAGTIRQRSADVALTFAANRNLQFDIGANFGLNDATPDRQFYLGVSARF